MHGQNGAQTKVGNIYKDRSNENRVRKNILPSNGNTTKLQPVLNLKSEDSRNNKFKATSQQKIESKLPDIHSPKVKTGNTLNPSHYTSRDPVKLPEVYLRPGHNSNLLSKVKCYARKSLQTNYCSFYAYYI